MTHHLRKSAGSTNRRENTDVADPDGVAGSFLWTGWPNSTILLNFLQRSVENPFNAVATFTSFRDAAAPDPLALYRDRESVAYTAIQPYSHEEDFYAGQRSGASQKPTTALIQELLLEHCPTTEDDFLNVAAAHFGVSVNTIRPFYLDAMSSGSFEKSSGRPPFIKFKFDVEAESWEKEHGLVESARSHGGRVTNVGAFTSGTRRIHTLAGFRIPRYPGPPGRRAQSNCPGGSDQSGGIQTAGYIRARMSAFLAANSSSERMPESRSSPSLRSWSIGSAAGAAGAGAGVGAGGVAATWGTIGTPPS